ncbi:MAG: hypothetical protein ACE5GL_06070, partial [Calditrichia bacterium]
LKFYNEDFLKKVQVYKTLTLVRHISISQTIPGRKRITADLISLCEERLAQQLNRNSRKYSNQLLLINTGTGGLT